MRTILALALFVGISAHAASDFECKVTYSFSFESGKPGSVDKHAKKADLKITKFSRRWVYSVFEGDFEIMASRKDGEKGVNAWISDKATGHSLLSSVQLAEWNGPLFLSLRNPNGRVIDGRKVQQVNLRCEQ